jgi:hypothetical protein
MSSGVVQDKKQTQNYIYIYQNQYICFPKIVADVCQKNIYKFAKDILKWNKNSSQAMQVHISEFT